MAGPFPTDRRIPVAEFLETDWGKNDTHSKLVDGRPVPMHQDVPPPVRVAGTLGAQFPAGRRLTVAQFLSIDWDDETHYELVDGQPVAMNPPARFHGSILSRLAMWLEQRLPARCSAITQAGIYFPEREHRYYEADLAVTCVPPENTPWIEAPVFAAEILSPSNVRTDAGKALHYFELPSVQEVLLIDSTARKVHHWTRSPTGTVIVDDIGDAAVPLRCVDEPLPLAHLYAKTTL